MLRSRASVLRLLAVSAPALVLGQRFGAAPASGGPIAGSYCFSIKTELRSKAIDFDLPLLDSEGSARFTKLEGEALWLNFFADWCPPCNNEMSALLEIESKYRSQGLTVVGIDVEELAEKARAFRNRHKIPYPIALDEDGDLFRHYFAASMLPTSLFYDRKRYLTCMVRGSLTYKQMENEVVVALTPR